MPGSISILGIRHHGPGSARMLVRALEMVRPDCVLIEGPADANDLIELVTSGEMKPPVALLVYEPQQPHHAAYYPFAEFSPEWQAIRWGLASKASVRFIDLPFTMRPKDAPDAIAPTKPDANDPEGDDRNGENSEVRVGRTDPLESLARAAGFEDGEAWWGRLIEEQRGEQQPMLVFDAIREAMSEARKQLARPLDGEESAREAHMRRAIRGAVKEGCERIAVVCGAWHAPALGEGALKEHSVKADEAVLQSLDRVKTAATWIPWTYERLSMDSGYGAGVRSPGWYEHLWIHRNRISESWLSRVARLMRDEDLDASPASVIESVRLAETLASMRGRAIAGLDELTESTLAILCHANPLPLRVIERKLIVGNRLGEVPEHAPTVPLQRDIAAQQKSLRMKVSADDAVLDLDQRKEIDLARSRLLHRLVLLGIPWGVLEADQRQGTSTFHEVWRLQWKPEFAIAVIEAARWGNTVHDAALARVRDRADNAKELAELTGLLDHVMLADLSGVVGTLIERIGSIAAIGADVASLMDALPALARILRYGNVRKTDAALVAPLVEGVLTRVCTGLLTACASMDDDAASAMRGRIGGVHGALATLARSDLLEAWHAELAKVADADIHGLVAGRASRLLLDAGGRTTEEAAQALSLALSPGQSPEKAAAWFEGFLAGAGAILVHDDALLGIIDAWICSMPEATFEQVCPVARRTTSTFEKPERRAIGERIVRGGIGARSSGSISGEHDDYDVERGSLVDPVLKLILGEPLP